MAKHHTDTDLGVDKGIAKRAIQKPSECTQPEWDAFDEAEAGLFDAISNIIGLFIDEKRTDPSSSEITVQLGNLTYTVKLISPNGKDVPYGFGENTNTKTKIRPILIMARYTLLKIRVVNSDKVKDGNDFGAPLPGEMSAYLFTDQGAQLMVRDFYSIDENGAGFYPSDEEEKERDIANQTQMMQEVTAALTVILYNQESEG